MCSVSPMPTALSHHFQPIFSYGNTHITAYTAAIHHECNGWKPTLILSGSKIGVANKWSKSIAIVANIAKYAVRHRAFPNASAITPGANRCNE